MAELNQVRKVFSKISHQIFPIVLLLGFFTAGIKGRNACNTFPFVGDNYFIGSKHFNSDIPLWKNFTENKLVV
jgi:hypothetical protein